MTALVLAQSLWSTIGSMWAQGFVLAQGRFGPMAQWSIVDWIIAIIVIAGAVGIMFIALKVMGVQIPPWAIQIFWIVIVVLVAIAAIRFIAGG